MRRHITAVAAVGSLVLISAPAAAAQPLPAIDDIDSFPIAQGNYKAPNEFYGLYFQTPDGRFCGILPNRGPVGCDAVPEDAPGGTNQTLVQSGGPASYRYSGTPLFTRDVDVLPEGHRLENWGASCGVGYQGTVTCKPSGGRHGFTLNKTYGVLW
ncbi:hypothetical protein [Micromonospora sp. WMMD736]|uniref:hypothetical protein n=1 Tax=Micromonospora sp. WMMD736 TaxID=3404112 RepID=UPI003B934710